MKEIKKEDIEFLKTICYVFKRDALQNPNTKNANWKDQVNDVIVEVFNFEQRMIDLINSKLNDNTGNI